MTLRSIFYNKEPRLRAGWRLLVQSVLLLFLTLCAYIPLAFVPRFNSSTELLYLQVASVLGTTLSILLARRLLDKRSFVSLGTRIDRWTLMDLLVGIGITFLMMALIFGIQWAAGWVRFDSFAWQDQPPVGVILETLAALLTLVLVGWSEELLSRGYQLQTLESGLNTVWAVLLSSSVFSFLHLSNPNVESIAFVASGLFLAGVFLAFGYLRTRQLWLPIGLHIGWNFFQGVIFGFPISGLDYFHLARLQVSGPQIWTGGAFGPEAGLVLIPGMLLGFVLVALYTRNRLVVSPPRDVLLKEKETQHSE
jgi:hypothetical protein